MLKISGAPHEHNKTYIHRIIADEKNDFTLEQDFFALETPGIRLAENKHYDNLCFYDEADKWKFLFQARGIGIGGPNRSNHALFNLKEDQWGCFLINMRYAGSWGAYGHISYSQDIYNIGNFNKFNCNFYIENKPNYCVDRLVKLF